MTKHEELIGKIEALLGELRRELGTTGGKTRRASNAGKDSQEYSGLTESIFSLVGEGFFREPRTISEIQKKLRLEGVNKPTTSLMKPLLLLIRKKVLGRTESADGKGPFKYHERGLR